MNPDIENQIKNNITWNKLSTSHKQVYYLSENLNKFFFINKYLTAIR
jgi:hypothetical protein